MRDSAVVASIVAGDPEGLAEAYDRHADSLYKYCRFLLSDPAGAADAVQDTFVIAASRTAELGEPDRLRAWLYAIARGECLRALRGRKALATLDAAEHTAEAGEVTELTEETEDTEESERSGLRTLIEDAVQGLDPAEREVVELHLWHGLEAAEIATVLGTSRFAGRSRMPRAMDQFEACLSVLLVNRAGPADCAKLASMLAGWDGRLTTEFRWWAHGHIKHCGTCTAQRAAALGAVIPSGVSADAALANTALANTALAAAAVESLRLADGPPEALKAHTLALAAGQDPSAVAYRAVLLAPVGRAGSPGALRQHGFRGAGPRRRARISRRIRTAATACAVLAVVAAAVAVAMTNRAAPVHLADGGQPVSTATAPATGTTGATAGAGQSTPTDGQSRPAATGKPRRKVTPSPSSSAPGPAVTPSATPVATPSASPTPTPTTAHPTPPPSRSPSPPPTGTLTVNPPGGELTMSPFGTTITLTASGSAVDWSVTVSSGSGRVAVWPSSGTLRAGQSVRVGIIASRHASGRQLTVSPGGTVFTIMTARNGSFAVTKAPLMSALMSARPSGKYQILPGRPDRVPRRSPRCARAARREPGPWCGAGSTTASR